MPELKTKKTTASVTAFINGIDDEKRKKDARTFLKLFSEATHEQPKMWGPSIIGFGTYHYKSERSTQQGDWFLTGFSPRKAAFSLYIMSGFRGHEKLLKDLGTYRLSSGCCIYVKKIEDINTPVLKKLIQEATHQVKKRYAVKK